MVVVVLRVGIATLAVLVILSSFSVQANGGLIDQFERSVGAGAVAELVKSYGGEYSVPVWERQWLDEVFQRLVNVTKRKAVLEYSLTVLNSTESNAFALPGGFVFITRGLLRDLKGDPHKLAAVLGHELAHVELKHGINSVLRQLGLTVLVEVGMFWFDLAASEVVRAASATLLQILRLGWGRDAEFEADLLGQELAYAAGFDPAGAVMLMDYLLSVESDDRKVSIFSTHPDSEVRRERMAQDLIKFWGPVQPLYESNLSKVTGFSRNSNPDPRMDLLGRFIVDLVPGDNGTSTLLVHDTQHGQDLYWLKDHSVFEAAWSPNGRYLAVVVIDELGNQGIWLLDRYGRVAHQWRHYQDAHISGLSWDESGKRLAYLIKDNEGRVKLTVGYVPEMVDVVLFVGNRVDEIVWNEDGSELAFYDGQQWFCVPGPQAEPVVVQNPIPRVVERRSFLSPTIERDGNTIRLTRPKLAIP